MKIDIDQVIDNMRQSDKKIISLNNGWNIKEIGNHREYEVFNDDENQIYSCPNKKQLKNIIEMIKV